MKTRCYYWRKTLLLLFFISFTLSAQNKNDALTVKINRLLNLSGNGSQQHITRHAVLLTAPEKLAALCDDPQLSLSGGQRLTGNRTVVAQCGEKKTFIQVRIEAEGGWWVAARDLKAGSVLSQQDLVRRSGSLASLPAGVLTQPEPLNGAVLTRALRAGQPLTESQLRKSWRVKRGDEVDVIAYGAGFQIVAKGKALDNAAVNGAVRIRMKSGQLVNGSVSQDGSVRINL
ncbi:flagellar basal body P-ring formation chaperone FlgA [Mixta tenebrionis]|uniref:Flagella basal body P-ring formation protein FlgA n=1 Tax=Mixta tenebrionis TaxID=2562439 RepID=A0A506V4X6_9GAMM|nr:MULTISPECIES: flagellar basal body P-ring formation chaperone FlgA [Mixta]QHM77510.1 Flagella basal body P-ring formation protein FlgA [Mixta theicola]TPW40677.1 flagellar basal body P-ring formation protein FlgA [Mixta tenebrionis]